MSKNYLKFIGIYGLVGMCISQAHALNQTELNQIIECKANHQQYSALGYDYDYEKEFKKLGWQRITLPDQPFIYAYKNTKSVTLFDHSTHEIALSGNAIMALYRDVNVQQFAKKFKIPEYTEYGKLPVYRGVKNLRTEHGANGDISYHINLNLSEMQGKTKFVLLGCSYEPDRKEMEQLLNSK